MDCVIFKYFTLCYGKQSNTFPHVKTAGTKVPHHHSHMTDIKLSKQK